MALTLSPAAFLWSFHHGYTLVYNDSMSHLNISRSVVDGMEPGLAQLGSVWLPVSHVLALLFIWNNWAWHSGVAGIIFSMAAYVVSVVAIFSIVYRLTTSRAAGFVGAFIFALNLNALYLQTTPLTEMLYVSLFLLSGLYLLKWFEYRETKHLFVLGMLGLLQVLTRYDGWFVVCSQACLIGYDAWRYNRENWNHVIGKLVFFSLPRGVCCRSVVALEQVDFWRPPLLYFRAVLLACPARIDRSKRTFNYAV
jgi:hypothetical protein